MNHLSFNQRFLRGFKLCILTGGLASGPALWGESTQQPTSPALEAPERNPEREAALTSALKFVKEKNGRALHSGYVRAKDPIARVVWGYGLWRVSPEKGRTYLIQSCRMLGTIQVSAYLLDEIHWAHELPNDLVRFHGDQWFFGSEAVIAALWSMAEHGDRTALDAVWFTPVDGDLAEQKGDYILNFIVAHPSLTVRWWDRFEPELGSSVSDGFGAGYFPKATLEKAKRAYAAALKPGDPRRLRMMKWLDDPTPEKQPIETQHLEPAPLPPE